MMEWKKPKTYIRDSSDERKRYGPAGDGEETECIRQQKIVMI